MSVEEYRLGLTLYNVMAKLGRIRGTEPLREGELLSIAGRWIDEQDAVVPSASENAGSPADTAPGLPGERHDRDGGASALRSSDDASDAGTVGESRNEGDSSVPSGAVVWPPTDPASDDVGDAFGRDIAQWVASVGASNPKAGDALDALYVILDRHGARPSASVAVLRNALEAIAERAEGREWETPGHPMNDWTKREPILRIAREALASDSQTEDGAS